MCHQPDVAKNFFLLSSFSSPRGNFNCRENFNLFQKVSSCHLSIFSLQGLQLEKTTLTCVNVSNLYFLPFLLFPGSEMRKTKLFLYCHLSTFSLSGKLQNNFNLCQCFYIFCPLFFSLGQSCIGGIVGKSVFASGSLFFEAEFS